MGPSAPQLEIGGRWLTLAVLFVARMVIAFQFQSLAPIADLLVRDFDIDYTLLGTLIGLYMMPGIFVAMPGGILGQRLGDKRTVVLGLSLMVAGGACVAFGGPFSVVAAGRLVAGIGAVLVNILLAKMVTDWFAEHDLVLAMALFVSSWPMGIGLALLIVPALTTSYGVGAGLASPVVLSAAALALIALTYRPALREAPSAAFPVRMNAREWALVILSGLVWSLFNVGLLVVLAFGPALLTSYEMSLARASATVSLVTWTTLLSLPLGGYLAQRLNSPDTLMYGCFVASAAVSGALAAGFNPLFACAVLGILAGPPPGLILALPGSIVRAHNRAAAMGLYYTCSYAGIAGLVPTAGLLRDATARASTPLYFGAFMMFGAAAALLSFRALQRRTEFS